MDKYTETLFNLVNESIDKFKKIHPEFSKAVGRAEIALNSLSILTGTLLNATTKDLTLDEKLNAFDSYIAKEKEWIKSLYAENKET